MYLSSTTPQKWALGTAHVVRETGLRTVAIELAAAARGCGNFVGNHAGVNAACGWGAG